MFIIPQKKKNEVSKELNLNFKGKSKPKIKVLLIKALSSLGFDDENKELLKEVKNSSYGLNIQ